jgi:hypothetical protein
MWPASSFVLLLLLRLFPSTSAPFDAGMLGLVVRCSASSLRLAMAEGPSEEPAMAMAMAMAMA